MVINFVLLLLLRHVAPRVPALRLRLAAWRGRHHLQDGHLLQQADAGAPDAEAPEAQWWAGVDIFEHWNWQCAGCHAAQFSWVLERNCYACFRCGSFDLATLEANV